MPGEHFQPHTAVGEVVDGAQEVMQAAPESVEFPHDQGVTITKGLETGSETGPDVGPPGSMVVVELPEGWAVRL